MVIQIDQRHIANPSGQKLRPEQRPQQRGQEQVYTPPRRSEVNYIPGPESLSTLVSSAVEAMRRGVFWDRGTILNILV